MESSEKADAASENRPAGGSAPVNKPVAALSLLGDEAEFAAAQARQTARNHHAKNLYEAATGLKILYQDFPKAFIAKGQLKPLKIGIFQDLREAYRGSPEMTVGRLRAAVRRYSSSLRYLKSFVPGAKRVDLQGNEVEEITEEHLQTARSRAEKISEMLEKNRARSGRSAVRRDDGGTGQREMRFRRGRGRPGAGHGPQAGGDSQGRDGQGQMRRRFRGGEGGDGSGGGEYRQKRRGWQDHQERRGRRDHAAAGADVHAAPGSRETQGSPAQPQVPARTRRRLAAEEIKVGMRVTVATGAGYVPAEVRALPAKGMVSVLLDSGINVNMPLDWLMDAD